MLLSRDRWSIRLLCTVLVVAFLAGLSICALDSVAGHADPLEHGHLASVPHAHHDTSHHRGSHAKSEHCCTAFASQLTNALRPNLTSIAGSSIAPATLPRPHTALLVAAVSALVPRTPAERLTSRGSPPASLRGPPSSLLG